MEYAADGNKTRYAKEKLNPVLAEITQYMMSTCPEDVYAGIAEYLATCQPGQNAEAVAKLKAQINQLESELAAQGIEPLLHSTAAYEDPGLSSSEDQSCASEGELPAYNYACRGSVSAEAYGEWNKQPDPQKVPVIPKSAEQKEKLLGFLEAATLFSHLRPADLELCVSVLKPLSISKGEIVIQEGDEGNQMFLVESGRFEVVVRGAHVSHLESPSFFGELALLYSCPRQADVICLEDAQLWALDRESFNLIVRDSAKARRERYDAFLNEVDLLKTMTPYERSQIADGLKAERFSKGDTIVQEGASGDKLYFVETGELSAIKGDQQVASYKANDYFGELALLHDIPRQATVVADSDCLLASLDQKSFKALMGPIDKYLLEQSKRYQLLKADH